jgi:CRP-like cAMP-binding protein/Fe-S-cluster-containing dehydrogenase component
MSTVPENQTTPSVPDDSEDFPGWREEGLFVRDLEGRLIRYDSPTHKELDREVVLTIDSHEIKVPRAVPATDEQGNLKYDEQGRVIPRATTVYDAVSRLYKRLANEGVGNGSPPAGRPSGAPGITRAAGDSDNPIPILCHTKYMDPVAVCRLCVVQIARFRRRTGKIEVDDKLLPACQHRVEEGMIIDTIESPNPAARERIRKSVTTLLSLLMADHPTPCAKQQASHDCELEVLATRFEVGEAGFDRRPSNLHRPDQSSLAINVDHNACILCDRCVRGCNVIKENHVIGRMGKGYGARIAFDLDATMGSSSCVACGECMVSCPTGALTHKGIVQAKLQGDPVAAPDLFRHPIPEIRDAFKDVARPFLTWNARAVVRREFRKGEVICREGEFGSTAFLIEKGAVDILLAASIGHLANEPKKGWLGQLGRFSGRLLARSDDRREGEGTRQDIPIDAPVTLPYDRPQATLGAGEIFGEMTCMSSYPRSATVRAAVDGTVVLEMLRNVLYIMQRSPSFRRVLETKYRDRAIAGHLRSVELFSSLRVDESHFRQFVDGLRPLVTLRRCEPGELICRQGAPATDGFYLVRTGFVKVSQARAGGEMVLNYVGPGGYIGEIALLSDLPELADLALTGVRTATCTALDHVDLVRITPGDFRAILDQYPAVRAALVAEARKRLESNSRELKEVNEKSLDDFLDQGLMNAQSLLVLDLVKCTRCDECTKACADTHGGVTRLIREGLRFDNFLVASSCRSCLDPYCMVGCPVGSIRRRLSREIIIEDWCIGCGLCAENCPYGNINMVSQHDQTKKADVRKATTCDLCSSLGPGTEPSCVYACPHDAAHRMKGPDLLALVRGTSSL